MKKLLKNIVYFIFPVVAVLVATEYLAENIPNEYSIKNDYLEKNSDTVEALYLGNSHVYFGINPEYSTHKSYNAAYISQSINLDWMIVGKYNWKDLKYIIIPADYVSMYYTLETANDKWRIKNYNVYYHFRIGYNPINYTEIFTGKIKDQVKRIDEFYIANQKNIQSNDLGFGTAYRYPSPLDIAKTSKEAAKLHTFDIRSDKYQNNFKINKAALYDLAAFAKKKNIKVVFLSSPVCKKYFDGCDKTQLSNTMKVYSDLLAKYPETCSHLNYMESSYFNESDFYDGDHLNNRGAQKLTVLVESQLGK
ncbi:hypothetical protein ACM46_09830 [Chryseobacterium angstadtii]|uniref:Uncharacterized protein n=1 Tax=Chryseobacterium angstadtii TaxID=558151 RepID=A0A0J7IF41_9FLAO|nr:hypothetical protein [Chryseobacterium angstadtii]KMQ64551.1 hypothetical protein ACM46_09830 [Chryseobacterium angstadtii]